MMPRPFRPADREAWLDLIALAIRLHNPKVTDLSLLYRAARLANKSTLPNVAGQLAFVRLVRKAQELKPSDMIARQGCTAFAFDALELLIGSDLGPNSRDALRQEALRGYDRFRHVLGGLSEPSVS